MNLPLLKDLVKLEVSPLMEYLFNFLSPKYTSEIHWLNEPDRGYLYVQGTLPVCLVAHLDTVHKEPVKKIVINKANQLSSPQGIGGDDRAGVYLCLRMLEKGLRPSIIFTTGEEVGGVGARQFIKDFKVLDNVNWFLEFDRANSKDVVRYNDSNDNLIRRIEPFGFKEARGSFTDISILAPHFKKSAVNMSAAYYNPHRTIEYIDLYELEVIELKAYRLLKSSIPHTAHEYKETKYRYSSRPYTYWDHKPFVKNPTKNYLANDIMGTCSHCGTSGKVYSSYDGYVCKNCLDQQLKNNEAVVCDVCGAVHEVSTRDRRQGGLDCTVCGNTIWL